MKYLDYLLLDSSSVKIALENLEHLSSHAVLFLVNEEGVLKGSITDGDIRRGLINGLTMDSPLTSFANLNPRVVSKHSYNINEIITYRRKNIDILPIVDKTQKVINVLNLRLQKSYLPIDSLVMAGGKGTRLRPLTENTPKPLLKVGNKPIIEHNLDRLRLFGIDDIWISVHYLGEQIENFFGDGSSRGQFIKYVWEDQPLGTLGAIKLINDFKHDYILVTNSDLLTTLDYEDFFLDFIEKKADMSVVTIPYKVSIPYAVLETDNAKVLSFKEKPSYTYYSNGGIYLLKREVLKKAPKGTFFNTTDLMEILINEKKNVISYPMRDYWLDIGKHQDYEKAQDDINHLKLD